MSSCNDKTAPHINSVTELDEYKLDLTLLNLLVTKAKARRRSAGKAGMVILTMDSATRFIEGNVCSDGQTVWPILGVPPTVTFIKGLRPVGQPSLSSVVERTFKSASDSVLNGAAFSPVTAPALSLKGEF